ncbi:hypothetical protein HALO59_150578 [Halomonas sp. 59]|nr:hypothetical protein HALO59_150578 [Halomonas sp. 59]CAD5261679.1 hypothetical protein HALO113_160580 [Halomonas sp. 113]CAD5275664.1 hypothetical protein HALOI3_200578 [Halomonas sp. I3]CAD5287003.1 hypothetical protein HALO156_40063 [Halomonas sp. 156]VXB45153.1 hypothetical protein HALO98_160574 [Halomonas titanicae]
MIESNKTPQLFSRIISELNEFAYEQYSSSETLYAPKAYYCLDQDSLIPISFCQYLFL